MPKWPIISYAKKWKMEVHAVQVSSAFMLIGLYIHVNTIVVDLVGIWGGITSYGGEDGVTTDGWGE